MSVKTIAVGTRVYDKLADRKRPGESFTKVIDRLLDNTASTATCPDAVREAAEIWGASTGTPAEADRMDKVIRDNRRQAGVPEPAPWRVRAGSDWGSKAQGERASRPFSERQHGRDARAPWPNQ